MEIVSLSLTNFRQFRDARIDFSEGENGVTAIHGQNGSGKTTILSAFPWILYGDVKFDNGIEHLPNEGVMAQADVNERVRVHGELVFRHEDEEFTANRWVEFRKEAAGDLYGALEDSGIDLVARDGASQRKINNPETRLKQILPKRLSDLFFFDGEDIDDLAALGNEEKIQKAIQNIMGLTILERSIRHLKTVEDKFEDRMEAYGSNELQDLIGKKRSLLDEKESHEQEIETKDQTAEQLEAEIGDIDAQLEKFDASRDLQQERQRLENRRDELEDRIADINDEIRAEISGSAYLEFAMPAIRDTAETLDELRAAGSIPSELSNEFVDRLLERGRCLCDRPLEEDTAEYNAVENWKSDTTVDGMDQAAIRLIAHLEQIADSRSDLFDELDDLVATRSDLSDEVEELTESIDEIGSKLSELDTPDGEEDPASLERRRDEKQEKLLEVRERVVRLEEKIERKQAELDELQSDIDEAEEEAGQALTARRRWQAAQAVRKELEESFEELQLTVREWSDQLVKQTFDKIARKELEAEITEEFKLVIRQKVGGEMIQVYKSTGERQIASLAFIGSLVSIARERYHADDDTPYFTGGIYPVVMDSPFGALDKDHRRMVGRLMPKLADQVVVMATDSQWDGSVSDEMSDHVGEEYWLDFDEGESDDAYPLTEVRSEPVVVAGGESK